MKKLITLSVIIPAYNEAGSIEKAIRTTEKTIQGIVKSYEIIVVNDGSTDTTSEIVHRIMRQNIHIIFIDRVDNRGLGYTFWQGVMTANKDYITQYHADCDSSTSFLVNLINNAEKADVVSTYPKITTSRSMFRRIISRSFVIVMNLLFGMNLRYFNGTFISRTENMKKINLKSQGLAVYAEAKVRLVKSGSSLFEVPFEQGVRVTGKSKAVNIKSVIQTMQTVLSLIYDIYIIKRP